MKRCEFPYSVSGWEPGGIVNFHIDIPPFLFIKDLSWLGDTSSSFRFLCSLTASWMGGGGTSQMSPHSSQSQPAIFLAKLIEKRNASILCSLFDITFYKSIRLLKEGRQILVNCSLVLCTCYTVPGEQILAVSTTVLEWWVTVWVIRTWSSC